MSINKLIKPILGVGTLLYSRGGFSELSNEQKIPAPIGLFFHAPISTHFAFPKNLFKNLIKAPV